MSMPQGGGSGQPWEAGPQAGASGQGGGPMQGQPISPVNEIETRVTGRRFVQYLVDHIIVGVVASLIAWALDRGTGATHAILVIATVVLDLAWAFWYWVYRPYQSRGQTFGMQLMGVRVISRDGGPASMMQLLIRAVLLIVDELVLFLVGFVTIMLSRYRQRVGDHAARTLVVRASVEPIPAQQQFAGAGRAGSR